MVTNIATRWVLLVGIWRAVAEVGGNDRGEGQPRQLGEGGNAGVGVSGGGGVQGHVKRRETKANVGVMAFSLTIVLYGGDRRRYGSYLPEQGVDDGGCQIKDETVVRELCFNYTADNGTCYDCVSCPDLSCVSNDTLHGYSCIEFLTDAYESCDILRGSEISGHTGHNLSNESCAGYVLFFLAGLSLVLAGFCWIDYKEDAGLCFCRVDNICTVAAAVGNKIRTVFIFLTFCCYAAAVKTKMRTVSNRQQQKQHVTVPSGETE